MSEFTEEETKGLFWANPWGKDHWRWYNMDMTGFKVWPREFAFNNPNQNHFLARRERRIKDLRFFVLCYAMERMGQPIPKWLAKSPRSGCGFIMDSSIDISHYPHHDLCIKVGLEALKEYDMWVHGTWPRLCELRILQAVGCVQGAVDKVQREYDIDKQVAAALGRPKPKCPTWMVNILREMGVEDRIKHD
jgi:hypothetical protein